MFIDSICYAHGDWETGGVKNDEATLTRAFELGTKLKLRSWSQPAGS
jgi:hypothetical protein